MAAHEAALLHSLVTSLMGMLDDRESSAPADELQEITGMRIEQAFSPGRVAPIRVAYTQVVRMRRPLLTTGLRAAVSGRCHVLFDRLLLPLASDGAKVDMLIGHLRHERIAG